MRSAYLEDEMEKYDLVVLTECEYRWKSMKQVAGYAYEHQVDVVLESNTGKEAFKGIYGVRYIPDRQ